MTPNGYYCVEMIESLREDGSSAWTAEHPELPGCVATGVSPDEALANLDASREAWIAVAADLGQPVPAPSCDEITILYQYARRDGARSTSVAIDQEFEVVPYAASA